MSRPLRVGLYVAGAFAGLVLIALLAAVLIFPSQWFHDQVRDRIVTEVERATGGRAEIGSFTFDWRRLSARIAPFTVHGTEPAGEAPLLRADAIEVGLKILSAVRRDIDIASLHVDGPQVNLLVDQQGHTNLPTPKLKPGATDPMQAILDLAVKDFAVNNGSLHLADRRIPLDLRAQNLEVHLVYDRLGPRYAGTVDAGKLSLDASPIQPLSVAFESRIKIERNVLTVDSAKLSMPRSNVSFAGSLSDFRNPSARFTLNAEGDLAELGGPLRLPLPHTGKVTFAGGGTYSPAASYQLAGKIKARGLAVEQNGVRVNNVALDSDLRLSDGQLQLSDVRLNALGGRFQGSLALTNGFKNLQAKGELSGLTLRTLAEMEGVRNPAWDGTISGPIELSAVLQKGSRDLKAAGTLVISPNPDAPAFEGKVDFAFDQRAGRLQLGHSFLTTPASRVNFTGVLGEQLQVHLETRDLEDLLPVVAMVSPASEPPRLPVRITPGGRIVFEGSVTGPTDKAEISGVLRAERLMLQDRPVDTFSTNLHASPSGIRLQNAEATAPEMKLSGGLDAGLSHWEFADSSPLNGKFHLQGASIAALLNANNIKDVPLDGSLVADLELKGTAGDPNGTGQILVVSPTIFGEKFDRLQADIRHTGTGVETLDGRLDAGAGRIVLGGIYTHTPKDFRNGQVSFEISTRNLALAQFKAIGDFRPGTAGSLEVNAKGTAGIRDAEFALHDLSGQIALRDLVAEGRALGDVFIDTSTAHDLLTFTAKGALRGSELHGKGSVNLTGDYPAQGELTFTPVAISVLQDLAMPARAGGPLPFDGIVEGRLTFSGPARHPDQMTARLELPTLELVAARQVRGRDQQRDLALRNQGPVIIERDSKGIQVKSAKFVGTETNLDLAGTLNLAAKNPWDLKVNGSLNLGVLEEFNPDMVTTGVATVNATVRGTLDRPQLLGRFELKNASLYMTDVPNGLDQANGVIVFDPNRATIEKLTATSGGGRITLSGYIVYGTGEPSFRIQARAEGVRIRYPEGLSTSSNAALNLTGSRSQSVLSGTITVLRASFNPQTDVGSMIAGAGKPIETPTTPNPYLRDMHLDVRVETVPNLTFQTALSNNVQAQADLRVRGTAARPAVLGHITVTQGEIEFFGNKYQINRGEIGFYNLARIEPVLAMDLETKVRGVDVNISFTGTLPNKLNFSYRSDPPLQSNEIIALLAMGRDPSQSGGLGSAQTQTGTTGSTLTPTGSLIGSALAAPVSNRLQRFFGVSRLKLDPSLTGIQTNPARLGLTIEQQVSRDITVTYVANLTDANQQIIRVQWDLSRTWSVVALREENGLFGVNFQFRKRFK